MTLGGYSSDFTRIIGQIVEIMLISCRSDISIVTDERVCEWIDL